MNIEQYKQLYAELAELDKQRTQGEWKKDDDYLIISELIGEYIASTNCEFAPMKDIEWNAAFIAQAPAMFKMIGELIARVEELEAINKRLKTTLEGTQTVLAGSIMAFANTLPTGE